MNTSMFLMPFIFLAASGFAQSNLPTAAVRSNLLKAMAAEMERLDGEALYVRQNRKLSWDSTVLALQNEASTAGSWTEFIRTLRRLDRAYPNLHSFLSLDPEAMTKLPTGVLPKVGFSAEWTGPQTIRYVISELDSGLKYPIDVLPNIGDEVVAINGKNVEEWKNENFEFCKWPLKEQCDYELPGTFQKELLAWNRQSPLTYTVRRGTKTWDIPVELRESTQNSCLTGTPLQT